MQSGTQVILLGGSGSGAGVVEVVVDVEVVVVKTNSPDKPKDGGTINCG